MTHKEAEVLINRQECLIKKHIKRKICLIKRHKSLLKRNKYLLKRIKCLIKRHKYLIKKLKCLIKRHLYIIESANVPHKEPLMATTKKGKGNCPSWRKKLFAQQFCASQKMLCLPWWGQGGTVYDSLVGDGRVATGPQALATSHL